MDGRTARWREGGTRMWSKRESGSERGRSEVVEKSRIISWRPAEDKEKEG